MTEAAVITCALTGAVLSKDDHPALPVTPEEIRDAARAVHDAGAAIVHVHVRDDRGRPTADVDQARRVLDLIQDSCPVLVQLSTGAGLELEFDERAKLVEAKPPMASLNVCSMTFAGGEFRNPPEGVRRLAARMQELGVKAELEIYDTGHLEFALRLCEEGLVAEPLFLSIVFGVPGGMPATPDALIELASRIPADAHWQAVVIGSNHLSLTTIALAIGGHARTGLEDTLADVRGQRVDSNRQLVDRLVAMSRSLGREPASSSDVLRDLNLRAAA